MEKLKLEKLFTSNSVFPDLNLIKADLCLVLSYLAKNEIIILPFEFSIDQFSFKIESELLISYED